MASKKKAAPEVSDRDGLLMVSFQPPGGEMGQPVYLRLENMVGTTLPKNLNSNHVVGAVMGALNRRTCRKITVVTE